jgi:hypothetical protein
MHTPSRAQKPSTPSSTIKKPMKLIDSHSGLMECIVCGSRHFASIQSGGRYYRGSWQCSSDFCPTKEAGGDVEVLSAKPSVLAFSKPRE